MDSCNHTNHFRFCNVFIKNKPSNLRVKIFDIVYMIPGTFKIPIIFVREVDW